MLVDALAVIDQCRKQVAKFGKEEALRRFVPPELIGPVMEKMRELESI